VHPVLATTLASLAALTLLGGDLGNGFVNQLFYSGGHSTLQPYTSHSGVDIYFGK
jgi:hypothetical protein